MLDISNIDKIIVKDQYDTFEVKSIQANGIESMTIMIDYPRRILNLYGFIFHDTSTGNEIEIEEASFSVDYDVILHINDSGIIPQYVAQEIRLREIDTRAKVNESLLLDQIVEDINSGRIQSLVGKEFFVELVMKPIQMKTVIR